MPPQPQTVEPAGPLSEGAVLGPHRHPTAGPRWRVAVVGRPSQRPRSLANDVVAQLRAAGCMAIEIDGRARRCSTLDVRGVPQGLRILDLGGDTDTIAARTGALAGARLGCAAIPGEWVRRTENTSRLQEIADRFARRHTATTRPR